MLLLGCFHSVLLLEACLLQPLGRQLVHAVMSPEGNVEFSGVVPGVTCAGHRWCYKAVCPVTFSFFPLSLSGLTRSALGRDCFCLIPFTVKTMSSAVNFHLSVVSEMLGSRQNNPASGLNLERASVGTALLADSQAWEEMSSEGMWDLPAAPCTLAPR